MLIDIVLVPGLKLLWSFEVLDKPGNSIVEFLGAREFESTIDEEVRAEDCIVELPAEETIFVFENTELVAEESSEDVVTITVVVVVNWCGWGKEPVCAEFVFEDVPVSFPWV